MQDIDISNWRSGRRNRWRAVGWRINNNAVRWIGCAVVAVDSEKIPALGAAIERDRFVVYDSF